MTPHSPFDQVALKHLLDNATPVMPLLCSYLRTFDRSSFFASIFRNTWILFIYYCDHIMQLHSTKRKKKDISHVMYLVELWSSFCQLFDICRIAWTVAVAYLHSMSSSMIYRLIRMILQAWITLQQKMTLMRTYVIHRCPKAQEYPRPVPSLDREDIGQPGWL